MPPSTTKEQRAPIYKDLVPLIVPGFLTTRLQVGGLTLGLRSLSSNDMGFLRAAAKDGGPDWPYHIAAASVWMVDGMPFLEGWPYSQSVVLKILRASHKSVVRAIFAQALSFFRRMRDSNTVFESFLYEEESRRLWKATNNGTHTLASQAGLPGVERLGLNSFQSSWVQWNRSEDDRLDDDYSWSLTKVLVSVQSSKSAKKLDAKDKARLESEKSRRSEVQDTAFHKVLGLFKEIEEGVDPAHKIHQPRTAAELSEEMRRWVSGELDFHDQVVEDYKDKVRVGVETQESESQRALEKAAENRARQEATLGTTKPLVVGYTPEQLAKLRPKGEKPGARFIVEASPVARTFNRYLRDAPDPGVLGVQGGKVVPRNPSISPTQEEAPSLNDLISNRKPTLNG